jgi:NADPH-dependent curcumin reductase CurA
MVKVNPSTAYNMLHDFAQLVEGDWIVQNGANGAVRSSLRALVVILTVRFLGRSSCDSNRRCEGVQDYQLHPLPVGDIYNSYGFVL